MSFEVCFSQYSILVHLFQFVDIVTLCNIQETCLTLHNALKCKTNVRKLSVWDKVAISLSRQPTKPLPKDFSHISTETNARLGFHIKIFFNKIKREIFLEYSSIEYPYLVRYINAGSIDYHYIGSHFDFRYVSPHFCENGKPQYFLWGTSHTTFKGNKVHRNLRTVINITNIFKPKSRVLDCDKYPDFLNLNSFGSENFDHIFEYPHLSYMSHQGDFAFYQHDVGTSSFYLSNRTDRHTLMNLDDFRKKMVGIVDSIIIMKNSPSFFSNGNFYTLNSKNDLDLWTFDFVQQRLTEDSTYEVLPNWKILMYHKNLGSRGTFFVIFDLKTHKTSRHACDFWNIYYAANNTLKIELKDKKFETFYLD